MKFALGAIVGTATALPPHRYDQRDLARIAQRLLPDLGVESATLERFFRHAGVQQRYLSLEAARYEELTGFGARNQAWLETALPLAQRVVAAALREAGLDPSAVDVFFSTTITGIAVPSVEARLMNRLPFRPDMKRVPLFGLGCLAGAAGIARAADYLRAYPTQVAVLLSVELCSLTVQRDDSSVANLISTGLFGDGAAAVVMVGAEHPLARGEHARVLDSQSHFFAGTERAMGWDITDTGFKIVLGREVPAIAREGIPALVDGLLARHQLTRDDVESWVAHPGGPAVMRAMCDALALPASALEPTRASLARIGNLSSASVLFLLDDFRRTLRPKRDSYGVMMAMGPAFCGEAVLIRW